MTTNNQSTNIHISTSQIPCSSSKKSWSDQDPILFIFQLDSVFFNNQLSSTKTHPATSIRVSTDRRFNHYIRYVPNHTPILSNNVHPYYIYIPSKFQSHNTSHKLTIPNTKIALTRNSKSTSQINLSTYLKHP
jgi:hypothetical protein